MTRWLVVIFAIAVVVNTYTIPSFSSLGVAKEDIIKYINPLQLDYFFHKETSSHEVEINYLNSTAYMSLVKSLTWLFTVTPLAFQFGGPILCLTPLGISAINGYIFYKSNDDLKLLVESGGRNGTGTKREFNIELYHRNRQQFLSYKRELEHTENLVICVLIVITLITTFILTGFLIYCKFRLCAITLVVFGMLVFVTSFLITFYNERNEEVLKRIQLFDEYTFDCVYDFIPTHEVIVGEVVNFVKVLLGYSKREWYDMQRRAKISRRCSGYLKEMDVINVSIPKVLTRMCSGYVINSYEYVKRRLGTITILALAVFGLLVFWITVSYMTLNCCNFIIPYIAKGRYNTH